MPEPIEEAGQYGQMMAYVDINSFQAKLHRWRFNLTTGVCHEERLSDRFVEFGMVNPRYYSKKSRYVWSATGHPGWLLFNGFVRQDTATGGEQVYQLPKGIYASEGPIVPRKGGSEEDDAYLVTFLIDENSGTSELAILDASDIAKGPFCRARLPHKISSGVHATWVEHAQLKSDAAFHAEKAAAIA